MAKTLAKVVIRGGRLRPFMRLLLSAAGILIVTTAAGIVAIGMGTPFEWLPRSLALLFWFNLLLLPLLLALYTLLTHRLEGRPLGSVGMALHPRWKNELVMGMAAGSAMLLGVASIERLLGVASFSLRPSHLGGVVLAGGFYVLALMVAASVEELIFRGYPFQRLVDVVGPAVAVIAVSILFGAAHLRNPFQSWISSANTALVGVLLAVCYLRTRALWLPIGIHFAWNFVQGYVLGFPVSGMVFPRGILQAEVSGPSWLTGGAYGPEGSILSIGVIAAGTVYFFVSRRIFATREMQGLALGPRNEEGPVSTLFSGGSIPSAKR
jgi:membrane protease YdiL (CAAX protease family)